MRAIARIASAAVLAATLAVSGCGGLGDLTGGTPPNVDPATLADHPAMDGIDTVGKNVSFAFALMKLYDQRSADLRDADYVSGLPLYAAGIATGALMLHNGSRNAIIDLGLGAAAYYGARSSLDFAGRAAVLEDATLAWQCFADAAARVSFLDPATITATPELGKVIQHDYRLLDRTLKKARAFLANGTPMAAATRQALVAAIDSGAAVLPAAERAAQSAGQAGLTLAKYRRAILRSVAMSYAGRRRAFSYRGALDGTTESIEQLVDYRTRSALARDKMTAAKIDLGDPQADIDTATGTPSPGVAATPEATPPAAAGAAAAEAGSVAQFEQFVGAVDPTDKDARKLRAVVYILMEMTERFSDNPEYQAVPALPNDLARCVP